MVMKKRITDEEVLREIEALKNDPDYRRGVKECRKRQKPVDPMRNKLYQMRWAAKIGREARERDEADLQAIAAKYRVQEEYSLITDAGEGIHGAGGEDGGAGIPGVSANQAATLLSQIINRGVLSAGDGDER